MPRQIISGAPAAQPTVNATAFKSYLRSNWLPIPLHKGNDKTIDKQGRVRDLGKVPTDRNWTVRAYKRDAVVAQCIREGRNMGVRIEEDQLVIDVDPRNGGEDGFRNLCTDFHLQPDSWPHVKTGSGGDHYYLTLPPGVRVVDTLAHESYEDDKPGRYRGVEFKSRGRQVVCAGSVHPNGNLYEWDWLSPPLSDAPECPPDLVAAVSRPTPTGEVTGDGQYTQEQIAAALDKLDVLDFQDQGEWFRLMCACHSASNGNARSEFIGWSITDPKYAHDAETIGRRWDSLHREKPGGITYKTLNKILADRGAADAQVAPNASGDFDGVEDDYSWLEGNLIPEPMKYDMTELSAMLDYAENAMLTAGAPLYQHGGRIVHPLRMDKASEDNEAIRRPAGALTIEEVPNLRVREYMIEHARFYRVIASPKNPAKSTRINHPAPVQLANHYLARKDKWRVPTLNGIIETPTLRKNGTLICDDGFDAESGLLLDFNGLTFPKISDEPTRAEALKALELIEQTFVGFPFVDPASQAVALSAVLTALVRRTLYTAPLHAMSAPTMGTGKTLLCNTVSLIAIGRTVTSMSQGASEEEDEKRLFSTLLRNDLIVMIDNVSRPIAGDALCTVLTEPTWQCRFLGESKNIKVNTNALFMASGNNLTFAGDMTTRALVSRLDARMEHPETRRFEVDLKTYIPERRTELVMAGLTIVRAFVVADRPGLDALTPFGRFEEWSNLVRGALVWLGKADPCKTRAFIAAGDPEYDAHVHLLQAIEGHGPEEFTAGELCKRASELAFDNPLQEAIEVVAKSPKQLGHYLQSKEGRIVGGLCLRGRYDKRQKVWRYALKAA
jgi:hypothetical protein